ncbi:serum amyloid A-4 protein-like isoform X3 [Hippopotamus amphibius kiboko]|uniref:serum amyloid A-4 protein-like isoform X3 n=1 Tax=Hippopotamus amphibius kiboko TaxID=575201 RepID=UPI002592B63C|nr:serum amyloid A-4 protein-like isoform X3 [Hippopotamus amphibius kiboko]
MKLFIGLVFCSLILGVSGEGWYSFFKAAVQGTSDMWRAFWDMKEANYQNSGRYFRARGNYEAAQRGPGGIWAAKILRENAQRVTDLFKPGSSGHGREDSRTNRAADEWGRSGKDPNHFRPAGLPDKY